MNIDEARARLKEHDALKSFVAQMEATTASPAETFSVRFEVAQALLPVALWRCNELALAFEEQKSAPAAVAPATPAGRPKVKPAVVEKWGSLGLGNGMDKALWEAWAKEHGFKWSSVQNVLRDLEAERAEQRQAERQKDPLNAGVTAAAENFASQHDADIQKDTFAKLAIRG